MIKEISNKYITLKVDTLGAQIMSLVSSDYEYMWQRDSKYWGKTAPNLFPFIGRLYDGKYKYRGKEYEMGSHGFIKLYDFYIVDLKADSIELSLSSNKETLAIYPFEFTINFKYTLVYNRVEIKTTVINNGSEAMHFSLGGHPGFNTPLDKRGFSDYYLEFAKESHPYKELLSPSLFMSGKEEPIKLRDDKIFELEHAIFDKEDTVILRGMADTVSLRAKGSNREVKLHYPSMRYLAIWQSPNKKSPYLCIEPWSSLPGSDGKLMDIENSDNYIHLASKEEYINVWSIEVNND